MQNSEYWEKRFILLNEMLLQKGENYFKSAQKSYADVMENIEKDINDFYMKFAHENNITFQQAKQILTTSERQAFQMKLNEYIKYGSKNGLSKEWVKKLKNASTVHRVTRLQALQYQFRQQIEKLEAIKEYGLTNTLKDIYKEGYYRTAYEIQRASGIGSAFSRIDERKIEKVLAKPWAADGKSFSERIWGQDRTQLLYQLENRFSQGMIRGESPQKIIKDIQKALHSSEYATRRLVMTESAFFASASRKETYNKLEVKQYKVLAVLDTKTSTVCRDMDGKVFDVKDYQPGLNANPFHANCRTTTAPYFNDEFTQQQERSARDKDGKTYYVPANMTYKEWYNEYVKDTQKVIAKDNTILKQQNQSINNVESLHNQQMKQLQEMAQQQKEQLEQLQNVINQQKQQLKQLQNETKPQKQNNSDTKYHTNKKSQKTNTIDKKNNLRYNKDNVRTAEELRLKANEMKVLAEQYSAFPSKWSGNIIVDNNLINEKSYGRKEWSCDIILVDFVDDGIILHELLHSCSSSHYPKEVFEKNRFMEEASVEFLKQQICAEHNIVSIEGYEKLVNILTSINEYFQYGTDLEFAIELFNVPFPDRYEWLRNKVERSLKEINISFEDYIQMMELLEIFIKEEI
ncbi:minor capsid protein [Lachnospiraceae bacterium 46-61]